MPRNQFINPNFYGGFKLQSRHAPFQQNLLRAIIRLLKYNSLNRDRTMVAHLVLNPDKEYLQRIPFIDHAPVQNFIKKFNYHLENLDIKYDVEPLWLYKLEACENDAPHWHIIYTCNYDARMKFSNECVNTAREIWAESIGLCYGKIGPIHITRGLNGGMRRGNYCDLCETVYWLSYIAKLSRPLDPNLCRNVRRIWTPSKLQLESEDVPYSKQNPNFIFKI